MPRYVMKHTIHTWVAISYQFMRILDGCDKISRFTGTKITQLKCDIYLKIFDYLNLCHKFIFGCLLHKFVFEYIRVHFFVNTSIFEHGVPPPPPTPAILQFPVTVVQCPRTSDSWSSDCCHIFQLSDLTVVSSDSCPI